MGLIVELKMKYDTGVEGLPTNEGDLRGFMTAPPAGMGYPATFGGLGGLRGKYFGYKTEGDMCYGFYTFTDRASLDTYMASELKMKYDTGVEGLPTNEGDLRGFMTAP